MSESPNPTPAAATDDGPPGYFAQSKNLINSLILVIPLLVVYEAGLLINGGKTLNGVDFITIFLIRQWGVTGILVFNGAYDPARTVGDVQDSTGRPAFRDQVTSPGHEGQLVHRGRDAGV